MSVHHIDKLRWTLRHHAFLNWSTTCIPSAKCWPALAAPCARRCWPWWGGRPPRSDHQTRAVTQDTSINFIRISCEWIKFVYTKVEKVTSFKQCTTVIKPVYATRKVRNSKTDTPGKHILYLMYRKIITSHSIIPPNFSLIFSL